MNATAGANIRRDSSVKEDIILSRVIVNGNGAQNEKATASVKFFGQVTKNRSESGERESIRRYVTERYPESFNGRYQMKVIFAVFGLLTLEVLHCIIDLLELRSGEFIFPLFGVLPIPFVPDKSRF